MAGNKWRDAFSAKWDAYNPAVEMAMAGGEDAAPQIPGTEPKMEQPQPMNIPGAQQGTMEQFTGKPYQSNTSLGRALRTGPAYKMPATGGPMGGMGSMA